MLADTSASGWAHNPWPACRPRTPAALLLSPCEDRSFYAGAEGLLGDAAHPPGGLRGPGGRLVLPVDSPPGGRYGIRVSAPRGHWRSGTGTWWPAGSTSPRETALRRRVLPPGRGDARRAEPAPTGDPRAQRRVLRRRWGGAQRGGLRGDAGALSRGKVVDEVGPGESFRVAGPMATFRRHFLIDNERGVVTFDPTLDDLLTITGIVR